MICHSDLEPKIDGGSNEKHLIRLLFLTISPMLHVLGNNDREEFMVEKFLPLSDVFVG